MLSYRYLTAKMGIVTGLDVLVAGGTDSAGMFRLTLCYGRFRTLNTAADDQSRSPGAQ